MTPSYNRQAIVAYVATLFDGPLLHFLSITGPLSRGYAERREGYFNDQGKLIACATNLKNCFEVSLSVNPVTPEALNRAANRVELIRGAKPSLLDKDITERRFIPIRILPAISDGVGPTNAEYQAAKDESEVVTGWLSAEGWPDPVIIEDGIGITLLYPAEVPNSAKVTKGIRRVYSVLAKRLAKTLVRIDQAAASASFRVTVPGTVRRAGDHTEERPHRLAQAINLPAIGTRITLADLVRVGNGSSQQLVATGEIEEGLQQEGSQQGGEHVVVNNRPLRDVSDDALGYLRRWNSPPQVFLWGSETARVRTFPDGLHRIEALDNPMMRGVLTRATDFVEESFETDEEGKRHPVYTQVHPPVNVITDLLSRLDCRFPVLRGIRHVPLISKDGHITTEPGYDADSQLVYLPPDGFDVQVPLSPSRENACRAAEFVREAFCDFPFADDPSLANTIALVLTAVLRPWFDICPMVIINAPQAGTGKGLLADVVAIIATGRRAEVSTACGSDEEWGKSITALLLEGATIILFDNVRGVLQSPKLEAALTAANWTHRRLGKNAMITVPNRATWIGTGNAVRLGGDLPRRTCWINLNARSYRPQERDQFVHADLSGWALQNRSQLVSAALTMIKAWIYAGSPPPKTRTMGSYGQWVRTIGGILEYSDVDGFLDNRDEGLHHAEHETEPFREFLVGLEGIKGASPFTVSELIAEGPIFEMILPGESIKDGKSAGWRHAVGNLLARIEGSRYSDDGLRVERVGKRGHVVLWKVVRDA